MRVEKAGETKVKVTARGAGFGDAMEKTFPIAEHGIDKLIAKSGKLRGSAVEVQLDLPKERRGGLDRALGAGGPLDGGDPARLAAVPHRLPLWLHRADALALRARGNRSQDAHRPRRRRQDGDVALRSAASRPPSASATHPTGKRSLAELPDHLTEEGLKRLADFQHSDGGWGWWKIGDSDRFMTAYVVWGLSMARDGGVHVSPDTLGQAATYLAQELVNEETSPDRPGVAAARALRLLGAAEARCADRLRGRRRSTNLWSGHAQMNAYTRALFALTAYHYGYLDQPARLLATNPSRTASSATTTPIPRW